MMNRSGDKMKSFQYRAGITGVLYTNINFAYNEAERDAERTQAPVILYQVSPKGYVSEYRVIKPKEKGCSISNRLL